MPGIPNQQGNPLPICQLGEQAAPQTPAQEELLTRTPALSRGQSYLMSQLSLPRSAGREEQLWGPAPAR